MSVFLQKAVFSSNSPACQVTLQLWYPKTHHASPCSHWPLEAQCLSQVLEISRRVCLSYCHSSPLRTSLGFFKMLLQTTLISPHFYPRRFERFLCLFLQKELTLGYNSQLTGFSSWDDDTVEGSSVHLSNLKYDRFGRAWREEKETPCISNLFILPLRPGDRSGQTLLWRTPQPRGSSVHRPEPSLRKGVGTRRDGMELWPSIRTMYVWGGRCQATHMSHILIPEMRPFFWNTCRALFF